MSKKLIKLKLESPKFQDMHNGAEWTPELDEALKKSVVDNTFNFGLVSMEIDEIAVGLGAKLGVANAYTMEKCRIRWFYLHCNRALEQKKEESKERPKKNITVPKKKFENEDKPPAQVVPVKNVLKFKSTTTIAPKKTAPVEVNEEEVPLHKAELNPQPDDDQKENLEPVEVAQPPKPDHVKDARDLWKEKEIREDKKQSSTYAEAEQYQWRQNIIEDRKNHDYLDVSKEDFSNYKTVDVEGNEITPSTFNIFRDSFKETFTEMRDTLKQNLPDLNLDEVSESDENEDVVPLDFRTKLMGREGDVVMQAKPLKIYKSDDDDGELIGDILKKTKDSQESQYLNMSTEDFLKEHRKDAFDENDENVILINPNTNIKEKLNEIDLDCNKNGYINNTLNAPKTKIKPPKVAKKFRQDEEDLENMKKLNKISRVKKKTVTINEKPTEYPISHDPEVYQPPSSKNDFLDFDQILKSQGVNLDSLLGGEEEKKEDKVVFDENNIMQLLTMGGIVPQEAKEEEDPTPEIHQSDTSENETAPMGALTDEIEPEETEEQKLSKEQQKELAFKKSLVDASSASEDERGFSKNKHPGLSSDEEYIDTTRKNEPHQSMLSGQAIRPGPSSMLSGQKVRPATDYSKAKVKSTGTKDVEEDTSGDLIIPYPQVPEGKVLTKKSEVSAGLHPQSLLFKGSEESAKLPVNPSRQAPPTEEPKRINYRGVWIESGKDKEKEPKDTEDEDRHFFNQQRELMKQRIKKSKNSDFGNVDKFKMENVGVEMVGDERLVKVERNWD